MQSTLPGTYSQQLYYQMNSVTGIFWQHFKPPSHAPSMYWLKPPIRFWRGPHVLNNCGKPWLICVIYLTSQSLNYVGFDKMKQLHINLNVTISVNELILTPFSPFDIKCKKRNAKNLWKWIFRVSRRKGFSYFLNTALDHGGCAPYPLQFLWIMLQYLV